MFPYKLLGDVTWEVAIDPTIKPPLALVHWTLSLHVDDPDSFRPSVSHTTPALIPSLQDEIFSSFFFFLPF